MAIGERIKKRREELRLSQEELAKRLGYKSRSSINKIELDINDITQTKVIDFATALQTSPAYLMGWEENDENKSEYKRKVISIHMKSMIKYQLANGQIGDEPAYIIDHLKELLDDKLDEDDRYTTSRLYVKFYEWLTGTAGMTDKEAICVSKVLSCGGTVCLNDDQIHYDILAQDMSLKKILSEEKTGEYGSRYDIVLNYESNLKIEILKETADPNKKNKLQHKLDELQDIIVMFNKECNFLDQYNSFLDILRDKVEHYKSITTIKSGYLFSEERTHIMKYRSLSDYDKNTVDFIIDRMVNKPQ